MGKVLFLSDIHGNMPALYALEKYIRQLDIDQIWFVGDAVGKGPEGHKAVDWVRGNSLGVPRAHAILINGEIGSSEASPISVEIVSVPYDNQAAASVAEQYPELPNKAAYQREVMTGIYSR